LSRSCFPARRAFNIRIQLPILLKALFERALADKSMTLMGWGQFGSRKLCHL